MILGVRALIYATRAEEVRAFCRDTLEWASVDAGGGWPIFALPPAELAVHPSEHANQELYLMCDDIHAMKTDLEGSGVEFSEPVTDQSWGLVTRLRLPGGTELGLYEPRHPSPLLP